MGIAAIISISVFPAMLTHMFGDSSDRGVESFQNLHAGFDEYWSNLKAYFDFINGNLFGGLVPFFVILTLFVVIYHKNKETGRTKINKDKVINWSIVVLPSIGYYLLISKIAVMISERYIMCVYALLLLGGIYGIYALLKAMYSPDDKLAYGLLLIAMAAITCISWKNCQWKHLYFNYKDLDTQMEQYQDVDCLYVADSYNSNIFMDYVEVSKLKSVTYFQSDMSSLSDMEDLRNQSEFILYTLNVDAETIIDQIKNICPQIYTCEQIGQKNNSVIWHLTSDFSTYAEEKIAQLKELSDINDYLMQVNDRCLSYCIQIKEESSVYADEEILSNVRTLLGYDNVELLDTAIKEKSNYFAVVDNGWQQCWETITGNDWDEISTTFGNLNYYLDTNSRPVLNVLSADTNYLDTEEAIQPDLQVVVVNRYLGSIEDIADFYMQSDDQIIRH